MARNTGDFWDDFDAKHGGDAIRVGSWLVYSDGACREDSRYSAAHEPPSDAYERAQICVAYWRERQRIATRAFDEKRSHDLAACRMFKRTGMGTLPPGAIDELKALRTEVRHASASLGLATAALERATPPHITSRNALREEIDAAMDEAIAEIQGIEV